MSTDEILTLIFLCVDALADLVNLWRMRQPYPYLAKRR